MTQALRDLIEVGERARLCLTLENAGGVLSLLEIDHRVRRARLSAKELNAAQG